MSKQIKARLGYEKNFKEVTLTIPDGEPAPYAPGTAFQVVNKPAARLDAFAKVTGAAEYTTDVKRPGMLYGRILRSTIAAGTIKKVDTSKAAALPGVKAIEVLPVTEIRFVGQPLAAVAATSAAIADDAIRLIKVLAMPKTFVVDPTQARQVNAPLVYAKRQKNAPKGFSGNVKPGRRDGVTRGDITKGFKEAAKTVEASFQTQVQTHSCLEPHGFVAEWKGDSLTVWASTQGTFSVRDELAQVFNMPASKVHVITEYMGGGFGSKFGARQEGIFAAKLAKKAGAPVRLICDRYGEHVANGNRPDSYQTLKLGAKADGTLTAMTLSSYGTGGIAGGAGVASPFLNLYSCPNKKVHEQDVFTHAGPARAFRAPGHPQGCFALESSMDMLAEKLGMDPLQFRLNNDPHPVRKAEILEGARRIGWSRRNKTPGSGKGDVKRGLGMASSLWYNTGRPGAKIEIKIHKDGTTEVYSGGQDIGTGMRTIVGQVVAEELGLTLDKITVKIGHTTYPFAPGSGGSKTTPCVTPPARTAAFKAREQLFALARRALKLPANTPMVAQGGKYFKKGDTSKSIDYAKLVRYIPNGMLTTVGERVANYTAYTDLIAGVQFAEVQVNTRTGQVKVDKIVAVHDCGLVLNPLTARSQVNGGVIQGISYALFEDRLLDPNTGRMVNANLEQYKIAGALDMPEIDAVMFDVYMGSNNTHAVGLGEPSTVPTGGAIANAVYNAIGARVHALPITPARVLKALAGKHKGGTS